jgi:hypothetical protein
VTRLLEKKVNIGAQDKTLNYGEGGDGNSSSNGTRYNAWGSGPAAGAGGGGNHNAAGSMATKVVRAKRKASAAADKAEAESEEVCDRVEGRHTHVGALALSRLRVLLCAGGDPSKRCWHEAPRAMDLAPMFPPWARASMHGSLPWLVINRHPRWTTSWKRRAWRPSRTAP